MQRMRRYMLLVLGLWAGGAMAQCPPGEVEDCNGNCYPASWIGDGVCDDGVQFPSDFMCAEFNWDLGDCSDCATGLMEDCNGNCWSVTLIGNGVCNAGAFGGPDYNCEVFGYDGGDCPIPGCTNPLATNYNPNATQDDGSCYFTPCPPGEIADCNGTCWPESVLQYLSDWHCHGELYLNNATYFYFGPEELNFNCAEYDYDEGDCITYGCTDPTALNYYIHATADDGSCQYGNCEPLATDCMGNCVPENWIGTNLCDGPSDQPLEHLYNGAYPDQLLANIPVGDLPRGMCVLPNGNKAYVAHLLGVTVIDLNADGSCGETWTIPLPGAPHSCSASINSQRVFVANNSTNQVHVINTTTDAVIANIAVGNKPIKMWTSHNGLYVYVSCNFANQVYMINAQTLAVVHVFNTGQHPRNICTSPDDTKLYTADWLSFTMSVFSTSPPYNLIATVPVDYFPQAIWASPDNKYVLVANFGFDLSYDHISVIRTSDWQMIARLQTGAGPEDMVSLGDDGQYLYVSNWGQQCCFYAATDFCCSASDKLGNFSIIALPDFDAIVPPGTIPDTIPYIRSTLKTLPAEAAYTFGMAVHPSGQFVYGVNMDSDLLSVIGFAPDASATSGDTCDDAVIIESLTDCIEGTTLNFEDDYNEACGFPPTGGNDRVYSYTPNATVHGSIDLCGSCYDTKLYIYEDECGAYNSGTAVYCNDDYCGINGWRSYLGDVTFYSGHTYYIVVDGYGDTDKGTFTMCFDMQCASDYTNDGIVNVQDLLVLISGYGTTYSLQDVMSFLADFGLTCGL